MLVQVKTRELVDQLPKQLRYDLIASFIELPEYLVFRTAVPYVKKPKLGKSGLEGKMQERHESFVEIPGLAERYPEVAKNLSLTQWRIFSLIQRPDGATRFELKGAIGLAIVSDNLVCSHLSALRRRFKAKGMPFDIENIRASGLNPIPKYKLVRL